MGIFYILIVSFVYFCYSRYKDTPKQRKKDLELVKKDQWEEYKRRKAMGEKLDNLK